MWGLLHLHVYILNLGTFISFFKFELGIEHSSEVLKVNLKIQSSSKEYRGSLLKSKISSLLDYPNKERLDREDVSDKMFWIKIVFSPKWDSNRGEY